MKSPHWRTYAYMLYIKIYPLIVFNRLNHQSVEQLLSSLHMPLWVEQTISSLTGESLEAVLALLIEESASLGYQKATVDAIIAAYQCFLESFPQSPYLLYFQEGIELNIAAYQATNFGPDFHFVEDSSIQTFQDLLAQYRGKKIFIDIWTITCGPCRKEFAYKEKLEPILQRNNAIALYIMLGVSDELKTKYKQTWESVIRKYDLKGYHYWANQPFIDDLQQLCDGESGSPSTIYVPWYMLIDEQGNILDKHFKRPSELVKDPSVAF